MARGYPDFFGFSVFPWHGTTTEEGAIVNVGPGLTLPLLALNGKRVIYNVVVDCVPGTDHHLDRITLLSDGNVLSAPTWLTSYERNTKLVVSTEACLRLYNNVLGFYSLYFAGVFSVGQTVSVNYQNNSLGAVNVSCYICGSLVN